MKLINTRKIIDSLKEIFLSRIGKNSPQILPDKNKEALGDFDGGGLDRYTWEDYKAINAFLWHKEEYFGGIDGLEQIIKDIIEINEGMSCSQDMCNTMVYRGTKLSHYPELLNIKEGMTLPLKAITSTSLDYLTAEMFTENNSFGFLSCDPLIFKIKLDEKTPFLRPNNQGSIYEIEEEIILPPAEYEVINVIPSKSQFSAHEVELKLKNTLDINELIINALDHLLENDPLETHFIYPQDIEKLKNKVNNYFKKKKSEKIRNLINEQIEDNIMEQ